ncbi:MAG: hypothetical protein ABIQ40_05995 [Bacteroidia bacterium]
MKSNIYSILLVLVCTFGISTNVISQQNKAEDKISFVLRGKVFAFVLVEDWFFRTGTLGGEILYKDRHSLGIDATWFRWRTEFDDDNEVPMYEQYDKRTYLYLDYKFRFVRINAGDFYLNAYDKLGHYRMWYKPQKHDDVDPNDSFFKSNTKGTFIEPGLGFGFKRYFNQLNYGFGIDCSANVGRRFSTNNISDYTIPQIAVFADHVKENKYVFYMRLNLFYRFEN